MSNTKEFPFEKSRRVTPTEIRKAKKAIEKKLGHKRPCRGRPLKAQTDKYKAISIRLHPKIIKWAKAESKKRGVGYQTVINEILLKKVA